MLSKVSEGVTEPRHSALMHRILAPDRKTRGVPRITRAPNPSGYRVVGTIATSSCFSILYKPQ